MKDEEAQKPQINPTITSSAANTSMKNGLLEGLFGRGKYKLWALGAITMLALWSMLTGTATLKWSHANLAPYSLDMDPSLHGDLDVLDVEEMEKLVRQMWNIYKHSSVVRLPSFWIDVFGAAYQDLTSDVASVRNAALLEIAKMSFRSSDIYDPPAAELASRESKEEARVRIMMVKTRKLK